MVHPLEREVWAWCGAHGLLAPGRRVVVAVSGGSDSVALLHLLSLMRGEYGLELVCAHFNHRLRGAGSDADEAFVRTLAAELDVACVTGSDDVLAYADSHHLGREEAARELRLRFLRTVAIERGADCIATAHTHDDQVETVLFRMFKGTGLRGLSGMAPRSGMFIRPLLPWSKEQLQAWLTEQGKAWREDASNADVRYERNFIRMEVIPLVKSRFPAAGTSVTRLAEMARASCELFERQTEQVTDNIEILEAGDGTHPGALRLPRPALAALPEPLLEYALEEVFATAGVGPSFERLTRSAQAIRSGEAGTRVSLDERLMLEVGYLHVYVYGAAFTGRLLEPQEVVALPAQVAWLRRRLSFEERAPGEVPANLRSVSPEEVWFDLERLHWPLTVRQMRPGDRILTFGGHRRKLQDVFTDAKVDRVLRARFPVVCDAESIIWLPGLARSAAGVVTGASHRMLRIVYYSSQC
ncbi:MAG: tRNA lysidine(34) synthetase TilS [Candidatus Cryosericum sp.]